MLTIHSAAARKGLAWQSIICIGFWRTWWMTGRMNIKRNLLHKPHSTGCLYGQSHLQSNEIHWRRQNALEKVELAYFWMHKCQCASSVTEFLYHLIFSGVLAYSGALWILVPFLWMGQNYSQSGRHRIEFKPNVNHKQSHRMHRKNGMPWAGNPNTPIDNRRCANGTSIQTRRLYKLSPQQRHEIRTLYSMRELLNKQAESFALEISLH